MPKVLVLAPQYLGLGGAQRYTRQLAFALSDALNPESVTVWSYLSGGAADGAGPRYLGAAASRTGLWGKLRFLAGSLRFGRDCQLIVACHVAVAPIARLLGQLYGARYVVVAHGIEVWGQLVSCRRAAIRGAERVVANSRFTASRVQEEHGVPLQRIAIVPPVVDPPFLAHSGVPAASSPRSPRRLLTVARLAAAERYKGCDAVIQALPRIRDAAGALEYVIVGDGDDRARLQRLADNVGVSEFVRFVGSVPDKELAAYYAGSDLFVMPSRSGYYDGRWQGEGFGIVFIEAAAFALPAIAGRGDGAEEAVQHGVTGIVVDGSDAGAVAEALRTLLVDEGLRVRMGAAARDRVLREFTYPRMQGQVRDLIAEVARVPA